MLYILWRPLICILAHIMVMIRSSSGTSCTDFGVVFVVDNLQSGKFGNISQLRAAATPLVLQAPQMFNLRSRARLVTFDKNSLLQVAQQVNITPAVVGIGEYSSFLSYHTNISAYQKPIGIYRVDGFTALYTVASHMITEIKKRISRGLRTLDGNYLCHQNASCIANGDLLNCVCNSGFSGDGFNCSADGSSWKPWGEWSKCSSSCSPGLQVRSRLSNQSETVGNETRPCNTEFCDQYSTNKLSCLGSGIIPAPCKLDALVQIQRETGFGQGSTETVYRSTDGKVKAKITKFKSPGVNFKVLRMREEENDA